MEIESLTFVSSSSGLNQQNECNIQEDNVLRLSQQLDNCKNYNLSILQHTHKNNKDNDTDGDDDNYDKQTTKGTMMKKLSKQKKKPIQTSFASLDQQRLRSQDVYHIFGDLCMTSDYQIKVGGAFGRSCLGFDCLIGESIHKFDTFVDLAFRFNQIQQMDLDTMISLVQKIPNDIYYQFSQALSLYNNYIKERKQYFLENAIYESEVQDEEYVEFSQYCLNHIKQLSSMHNLFSYCVGRIKFSDGSIDISHIGYSNDFLDLVCLNFEIIEQMVLRDRQFSLVNDLQQILEQSLLSLINRVNETVSFTTRVKITTLDGYDLWVDQISSKIFTPFQMGQGVHYFFCFCELDMNIEQLKGLLDYRQQICSNQLNYENFMKRELSFYSEDIEYSIMSQQFLEKYYKDTINNLKIRKNLEEQQHQSIQNLKSCGYRSIS